jgi:hypothetical protein
MYRLVQKSENMGGVIERKRGTGSRKRTELHVVLVFYGWSLTYCHV